MNPSLNRDGGRYNLPPVWNNIIKQRVRDGAGTTNGGGVGGGAGLRNSVSVPVVSNTIWRLRHTDEGCSDGQKLCKNCQFFILYNEVTNLWIVRLLIFYFANKWSLIAQAFLQNQLKGYSAIKDITLLDTSTLSHPHTLLHTAEVACQFTTVTEVTVVACQTLW